MRWVGGSGSQLGEEHDSSAIKMAMAAGAGTAASGAGAGVKAVTDAGAPASPKSPQPPTDPNADPDGAKTENELSTGLSRISDGGDGGQSRGGSNNE